MEELLAAGVDGRGALPVTLRDALMVRIEQLTETTQELLRVLAVGQHVDHATLGEVSGLPRAELVAALREGVASHLVVAQADDRYAFRHALLREVVADDLLPGERIELHRAFAGALERRAADGPAGAQLAAGIAHHYAAAGDQRAALGASVRAGIAAEAVHAFGEAALLFERALELWDRVPGRRGRRGHGPGRAAAPRGRRVHRLGRPHPPDAAAARRARDGRRGGRAAPRRRAHRALAMAHWRAGRPREGLDTAERALALVEHGEPTPERATIYAWWAKTRMLQGRYREATEAARKAIEAAEATGNQAALSGALNGMGTSLSAQGAVEEGTAALRRAIEIARDQDRPRELESAQVNLADALHLAGRDREALAVARAARQDSPGRGNHGVWLDVHDRRAARRARRLGRGRARSCPTTTAASSAASSSTSS